MEKQRHNASGTSIAKMKRCKEDREWEGKGWRLTIS